MSVQFLYFETASFRQNIYEKPFGIYQIRL